MKKKLIALMAGALLTTAFAGNAMAYFTDMSLVRVVYNLNTNVEIDTDLGTIGTNAGQIDLTKNYTFSSNPFSIATQFSGAAASDLRVFYVAKKTNQEMYISNSLTEQPLTSGSAMSGATSKVGSAYSYDKNTLGGSTKAQVTGSTTATNGFYKLLNPSGNIGSMGQLLNVATQFAASQPALVDGGQVSQGLWYFKAGDTAGTLLGSISTLSTGTSVYTANTVTPIPAPFVLMGSGLLGLVGIRRKNRKA